MASPAPFSIVTFRRSLLRWYDAHRRDLPWRKTRDPYKIWVSEIMLQQTRVAAVEARYKTFVRQFPSLKALASAPESQVLAAWSGLGYYRRARSLRAAARVVVRQHRGRLPHHPSALQDLPGIGRYTAAAIASIAFGHPAAVVDGNVERVLSRLFGRRALRKQRTVWERAQELLSIERPGDFNQAMMELGATTCLPANPRCTSCPVRTHCVTRGAERSASRTLSPRRVRVHLMLDVKGGAVRLARRPLKAPVMPGMWELPEMQAPRGTAIVRERHSITTTAYEVHVFRGKGRAKGGSRYVTRASLAALPLTGLTRKILQRTGWLDPRS